MRGVLERHNATLKDLLSRLNLPGIDWRSVARNNLGRVIQILFLLPPIWWMHPELFNLDRRWHPSDRGFVFLIANSRAALTPLRLLVQTWDSIIGDMLMTWGIEGQHFLLSLRGSRRRRQVWGSDKSIFIHGSVGGLLIIPSNFMRRIFFLEILLLVWLWLPYELNILRSFVFDMHCLMAWFRFNCNLII